VAEFLAGKGREVTYITTAGAAAAWGFMTNEQPLVHQSFARKGIALRTLEVVTGFDGATLDLAQIFSGEPRRLAARSLVIVGLRAGGSPLHAALLAEDDPPPSVHLTGDANAPGAIVHAVYQGHRTARELGLAPTQVIVRRDAPFAPRDLPAPQAAE
jgi:dimethylamine/trimethylamine dehydrogenase